MEQVQQFRGNHSAEKGRIVEDPQTKGKIHACKASQRGYQQACDRLKRAERDLAETAAFIAGSLTTVTAVQAVITLARKELELPMQFLQWAFQGYIAIFLLIFVLGAVRVSRAIRKRTQAEWEIDQTKKGIIEFCPLDQWPKPDG
jgi:cytochrome c biogenesis protein CcdA